jgi:hypothetical protein
VEVNKDKDVVYADSRLFGVNLQEKAKRHVVQRNIQTFTLFLEDNLVRT